MLIEGIKSRPHYQPLAVDPTGRRHLLVADRPTLPSEAFIGGTQNFSAVETWVVESVSTAIPGAIDVNQPTPELLSFRSTPHLLARLAHRLKSETMGCRLYAVGTEAFLWDAYNVGHSAGFSRQEMHFFHIGSARRRIFCVHCRAITPDVSTNIVPCVGCGAQLLVRDHFSRRLAAFMGVQIDAEAPGELPEIEEVFR